MSTAEKGIRRNEQGKKVVKIVLTGGPCAGKSTGLERVQRRVEEEYGDEWNVFAVAEAAFVLYSIGRISRAELSGERLKRWQRDLIECAITFEKAYDNIAAAEHKKHTLILCDRGAMDSKVFTPPEMWPEILEEMDTTEDELMQRYDKVLVLHTAPEANYSLNNNSTRRETSEQAKAIDAKYKEIWSRHNDTVDIKSNNEYGFEEKLEEVWNEVKVMLGYI